MGLIISQQKVDNLRAIIDTLVENGKEQHWAEMRRDLTEANRRFEDRTIKRTWVETEKNSDHCTVH